jgi:lysozyme
MKTGPDCLQLLHYFEQCRLIAYPDPATGAEPWTVGWGSTGPDVVRGLVISQAEADGRLAKRLVQEFEPGVNSMLHVSVTQRQFDALVSFAYNEGLGNLRSSTLLACLNRGQVQSAANQFPVWNKANGQVMLGLRRRRAAEQAVFLGQSAAQAIATAAAIQ